MAVVNDLILLANMYTRAFIWYYGIKKDTSLKLQGVMFVKALLIKM